MRIFFAFMVVWLSLSFPLKAQNETSVNWFESLWNSRQYNKSNEEQLRLLQSNQLVAKENHDGNAEARALIELATYNLTKLKDYGAALDWLMQSIILEDTLSLKREKVFTFITIARIFEEVGDFQKSTDYLNQAYERTPEDDWELLILILNERGRLYAKLGNSDDAVADYQQMLKYAQSIELREREADALYQLGQLLGNKKEFENALKDHKQALAIRRELKNKVKEAQSLNSVGQLYLLMKNVERAKANHEVALKIRQQLQDSLGLAESYNNIGSLYIAQREYKQAIKNLEIALSISQEIQVPEQTLKAHEGLSLCYKELNDFRSALYHREILSGIADLIQREKNDRQLLEIQNSYAIKTKEGEINKLVADRAQREKTIEAQNKLQKILFLVIALGAIIGGLVLYLYFLKRRSNRKLEELNETKDKLFSIIGHDLKGPLNSLTAFSSLLIHHAETLTKEEIKMLSGDVDKSLKNLFALLENLLEWARSQTGNIDFKASSFDLASLLKENQELLNPLAQRKNITIVNESEENLAVNAHRHSINTVVRNLISNAIKFTPIGGEIVISTSQSNKHIQVTVADNGVGMGKESMKRLFKLGTKVSTLGTSQEKGTGLGLILCKDFVEKNGGTIGVDSVEGRGSKFYFTVPVS